MTAIRYLLYLSCVQMVLCSILGQHYFTVKMFKQEESNRKRRVPHISSYRQGETEDEPPPPQSQVQGLSLQEAGGAHLRSQQARLLPKPEAPLKLAPSGSPGDMTHIYHFSRSVQLPEKLFLCPTPGGHQETVSKHPSA